MYASKTSECFLARLRRWQDFDNSFFREARHNEPFVSLRFGVVSMFPQSEQNSSVLLRLRNSITKARSFFARAFGARECYVFFWERAPKGASM